MINTTMETVEADAPVATLTKYEISTPKNGSYYTEGGTISFAVVLTDSDAEVLECVTALWQNAPEGE